MACCSQGISPQLDMWRVSNGSGRIRAAGLGRDELRSGTRWREKRAGNSCFKDDRKPGNVELCCVDMEKIRLPSTLSSNERKELARSCSQLKVQLPTERVSDPSPSDLLNCPFNPPPFLVGNQTSYSTETCLQANTGNKLLGCRQASKSPTPKFPPRKIIKKWALQLDANWNSNTCSSMDFLLPSNPLLGIRSQF